MLEVTSQGQYDNIVWNRNAFTLGSSKAPALLREFAHFFEMFIREPTTPSDFGVYYIFYSGSAATGTQIVVTSHGKSCNLLLIFLCKCDCIDFLFKCD